MVTVVIEPKDTRHYACRVVKAKEVLVILLHMEYNGPRQLHFREQVEVPQNEKDLALRFKLSDHELLKGEEVIINIVSVSSVRRIHVLVDFSGMEYLILSVLSIS